MSDRKETRKYAWYVCGKCKNEIYRLRTEEDIVPCNECGAVYDAGSGELSAYVSNGDMEAWTGANPDDWTLAGAGAAVAQESTIIKAGTYSAKVTRAGADCYLGQSIYATKGLAYWAGMTVYLTGWVYATVADRARLAITDGIDTSYTDYHTGGSGWERLTVYHTIASNMTDLAIRLQVNDGDTSAYFDEICTDSSAQGGTLTSTRAWSHRTREPSDVPLEVKYPI